MNALARKVLTRPIWWWERNRPFPVKSRIEQFPPLPVPADASVVCVVLSTAATWPEAAWTARSLLLQRLGDVGLVMAIDGSLENGGAGRLRAMFPGCAVLPTSALVDEIREKCPCVARLSDYHPMGRKLATILALQERHHILFADNDILAFHPMPELTESIRDGIPHNLYIQEIDRVSGDDALFAPVRMLGLPFAETINVGLLLIRKSSLSLSTAERVLAQLSGKITDWFPDTMVLSVLMQLAGALPLPRAEYVVSTARQFWFQPDVDYSRIRVRHFTGPVRHLLYMKGMPYLAAAWN